MSDTTGTPTRAAEPADQTVRALLDKLEHIEARLLTWGIVDGAFTPEELQREAELVLAADGGDYDPYDLLDVLRDRGLLFRFSTQGRDVWRTRMGETVRLLVRLRQLFPSRPWQTAPTLVSDFRFTLRPRAYPARDICADHSLFQIEQGLDLPQITRRCLDALLRRGTPQELKLARFQVDSAKSLLRDVVGTQPATRGLVVGAGTGTGKTLAFYLPALAHLAHLVDAGPCWTKALAIYPRQELLKDQFQEAFELCRTLDPVLAGAGRRSLSIGAFFNLTPFAPTEEALSSQRDLWRRVADGWRCPLLTCSGCGAELIWPHAEVRAGRESLLCPTCNTRVSGELVRLTRQSIQRNPPDILFTTTETLNRRMSDMWTRHVFGVGTIRPPRLVLLDEIHTYGGTTGAQAALLLRRWRAMIGDVGANTEGQRRHKIHFTGLSATLPDAAEFFASLIGVPVPNVEEITPPTDSGEGGVLNEGMEYQLALRGDPVSATSLLSTTIQTTMLLQRMLDPPQVVIDAGRGCDSRGLYGRRTFVFTDDLDVNNRLFHNLLDAEARDSFGNCLPPPREPLARLRVADGPDANQRSLLGQAWRAAAAIGDRLTQSLRVGRVSSQDRGIDADLDVAVATASLEVGFNDPDVGAVIQHKAPRDMASFLQRKGRAGRHRQMRPWTVVVLSDYGRDREAFQNYDQLFAAIAQPQRLPVGNRYVLKMQAVFALIDYLSRGTPAHLGKVEVRKCVAREAESDIEVRWQTWLTERLRTLLEDEIEREQFTSFLRTSLAVDRATVEALLWDQPRALMTAVIPTVLRRLERHWLRVSVGGDADRETSAADYPLPEFIPSNLFSDLQLPEVVIEARRYHAQDEASRGQDALLHDEHCMPVGQALRVFPPGRVSRRFGTRHARVNHWFPVAVQSQPQVVQVRDYCASWDDLGEFQAYSDHGEVSAVHVLRPWRVRVERAPANVLPTSNSFARWCSQFTASAEGVVIHTPESIWADLVPQARFIAHRHGAFTRVRRFAVGADANVRTRDGTDHDSMITFVDGVDAQPGGVGFVEEVDGICFEVSAPSDLAACLLRDSDPETNERLRGLRVAFFHHRLLTDTSEALAALNVFRRGWLYQVYLSALVLSAARCGTSIEQASQRFHSLTPDEFAAHMNEVLDVILQALPTAEDQNSNGGEEYELSDDRASDDGASTTKSDACDIGSVDDTSRRQRIHDELRIVFRDAAVQRRLGELAGALWDSCAGLPEWSEWLTRRYFSTIGHALLSACRALAPDAAESDLLLDINSGPPAPDAVLERSVDGRKEIWVTEAAPGGAGVIEQVFAAYAEDPGRFFFLAQAALQPSDAELVNTELTRIVKWAAVEGDGAVTQSFANVRSAIGMAELEAASEAMRTTLRMRGARLNHSVLTALYARVLRPLSSPATDTLLHDLLCRWGDIEQKLGLEVALPVFAYLAACDSDVRGTLRAALVAQISIPPDAAGRDATAWAFLAIYGLLWPRGEMSRRNTLSTYNPFAKLPDPDTHVLLPLLRDPEADIRLDDPQWDQKLELRLRSAGTARLIAPSTLPDAVLLLKRALLNMAYEPIQLDFMSVYPVVEGIEEVPAASIARLRLREAAK